MNIQLHFLLPAVLLLACAPGRADIYAFVDSNGVRHISNIPDDPRYKLIMRTPKYRQSAQTPPTPPTTVTAFGINGTASRPASAPKTRRPFGVDEDNRILLSPQIQTIAVQFGLEPALIHAVISAESAFNPTAVSHAGAQGLMQLMPATAKRFGVTDPFDPIANIRGGARYLRWLLDQFQRLDLALAGYNAGENAVIRYGRQIPPYRETQTYVARVMDFYQHYRQEL